MAQERRLSIDPYGFERPDDFDHSTYEDFMASYLSILARRAKKWEDLLDAKKNVKKGYKVKRYVRKGIPRKHRGTIWMAVSGGQELKDQTPDLYSSLLSGPKNSELIDTIELDIPRTFPDNIYFKNSPDGKRQLLFNVLVAFAHQNQNVGYCQGLNYIAGILLLITEDEEITFWLLRILVENILPDYYTKEMMGLRTDLEVFSELVKIKVPDVYNHMKLHNVAWAIVITKWFICLYAEVLPIETVLRIWDCLFYEGSKILFRVGITMIIKNKEKILKARNFSEIAEVFKGITQESVVIECHSFMQAIFTETGSFSSSLIRRLREECRARVAEQSTT
ncbi:growth hormone-regulated TBC protein 1-A-like [Centruroides vittatus]|uniref:growth hormone-regulated TBC protein 1-A-like n=1 Tax=Centruroides vittatus TaxID=120091 RepID=UPI00350EA3AE